MEGVIAGERLLVGEMVGVPDVVRVTDGVALLDGVPDREPVEVTELVGLRVKDEVGDSVLLAVGVSVGESDGKLPGDGVSVPLPDKDGVRVLVGLGLGVSVGVGLGLGSATPWMYTEVPKAVPALATLSHIKVVKVATAAPQYTRFSERSPKLTPLLTGAGG